MEYFKFEFYVFLNSPNSEVMTLDLDGDESADCANA